MKGVIMGLFSSQFTKEGPGIAKDAPKKKGLSLFFETFFREFWQLIKLNLIFVLYCIPIVTIGPAVGAMTSVTVTMVRDLPTDVFYDFRKAFRENWKRSFLCGLLFLAVCVLIYISVICYMQLSKQNAIYNIPLIFIGVVAMLFSLAWIYVYPMAATIDLPLKLILKNSALLGMACLTHSLPAVLLCGVLMGLSIWFLPLTAPAFLLFTFSFISFISSFAAWAGIEKYIVKL